MVVREIGGLVEKMEEYTAVTLDLTVTKVAWEVAQNDPKLRKNGAEPLRPTMRPFKVELTTNPAHLLGDVADLGKKVDKIDYLTEQQRDLRQQVRSRQDAIPLCAHLPQLAVPCVWRG